MFQLAAGAQVLVLAAGRRGYRLVLLLRRRLELLLGALAVDPAQFRHRAQQVIEDVDDGGHVAARPALGVLQGGVQGAAESAGVDTLSATCNVGFGGRLQDTLHHRGIISRGLGYIE